jgi:hypothetical protein
LGAPSGIKWIKWRIKWGIKWRIDGSEEKNKKGGCSAKKMTAWRMEDDMRGRFREQGGHVPSQNDGRLGRRPTTPASPTLIQLSFSRFTHNEDTPYYIQIVYLYIRPKPRKRRRRKTRVSIRVPSTHYILPSSRTHIPYTVLSDLHRVQEVSE